VISTKEFTAEGAENAERKIELNVSKLTFSLCALRALRGET
jgi:hypothetical protein